MPRGRKPKVNEAMRTLPFSDDDAEDLVQDQEGYFCPREKDDEDEAAWWTGKEIASVFKTRGLTVSAVMLRKVAIEMELKKADPDQKGKTFHYTFTDVQMLQRELLRRADERKPRDTHEMCKLLSKMLDEADNKGRR